MRHHQPQFPRPFPRRRNIKRMRVIDAGADYMALFQCHRCGAKSDWVKLRTRHEIMRGLPCMKCNEGKIDGIRELGRA